MPLTVTHSRRGHLVRSPPATLSPLPFCPSPVPTGRLCFLNWQWPRCASVVVNKTSITNSCIPCSHSLHFHCASVSASFRSDPNGRGVSKCNWRLSHLNNLNLTYVCPVSLLGVNWFLGQEMAMPGVKLNLKQVAQLWQRDRASSVDDFKGWVILRLNFRLKGYFSPQYLWTIK